MSRHFTAGTSDSFNDTGPGTILVDPLARIVSTDPLAPALDLDDGGWDVTIKGLVFGVTDAIALGDPGFVSTIRLTSSADVSGGTFGIIALHATNISNA